MNINQAMRAMTDPDNNMAKFAGGLQETWCWPIGPRRVCQPGPVPVMPGPSSTTGSGRLPGASEMLPPRRDVFGDPVERKVGLTTTQKLDPVEAEHNRLMLETERAHRRRPRAKVVASTYAMSS